MDTIRRRRILTKLALDTSQLTNQPYAVSAEDAARKASPFWGGYDAVVRNAGPPLRAAFDYTVGNAIGKPIAAAQDVLYGERAMADDRRFAAAETQRTTVADNQNPWSGGAMGRRALNGAAVGSLAAGPIVGGIRAAGLRSGIELAKGTGAAVRSAAAATPMANRLSRAADVGSYTTSVDNTAGRAATGF